MIHRLLVCFVASLLVFTASVRAEQPPEPLKLTDGRVFSEWRITGESAAYVTVRHKGGMSQVSKKMLPEPLRASYPIDKQQLAADRAAEAQARQNREAKSALEAQARREQAARSAESARATAATAAVAVPPTSAQLGIDRAMYNRLVSAAKQRAEQYFRYEFEPSNTSRIYSLDVSINTDDPGSWPGIPGRYTVKGKGFFVYYGSRGYSGFDRATKDFTAFIDVTQFGTKVIELRVW